MHIIDGTIRKRADTNGKGGHTGPPLPFSNFQVITFSNY